ncbi:hypothetical protein [Dyadobacter sandarakinus]|uniref:Uncharacterized protein n=1 Tax=Dyadobacter sandarakinus TaxID=2747268 RepID=A0ABX7IBJ3_9BACT|nr:hypothetical protein [Dyadobacter sandarakinus]QRR03299.1 hypothetical protein HWI92_21460 [Dyadobacter sandarakinus]
MTHALMIETKNAGDFELIKELAQQLGAAISEEHSVEKPGDNVVKAFAAIQQRFPVQKIPADTDINAVIDQISE